MVGYMDNLRSIVVKISLPEIRSGAQGYFHRWCDQPYYDSSLDYPLRKTFALIEFIDGSIRFMDPETIKFTEPYTKKAS